jgi:hypothetical protein
MKRLMLFAAATGAALALTGCGEPAQEDETAPPPMEAPAAPAATDQAAPAAETGAATDQPPADSTLPPEQRTSEETVQPESETLFY